jgi:hypothetical protein
MLDIRRLDLPALSVEGHVHLYRSWIGGHAMAEILNPPADGHSNAAFFTYRQRQHALLCNLSLKGNDMNLPNRLNALTGSHLDPMRNTALWTGIFFIITYITSITALLLFDPVLNDANYIVGPGSDNRLILGAFLEMILIIANIATAVVLFPLLKRQSEVLAHGFVAARIVESVFIAIGLLSILAVVTLRQDVAGVAGTDSGALLIAGQSLVAIKDATFMLGPGFVVGVGNGMILGYLMYTSHLVPRPMAMLGLIGGPLIVASGTAVMFDVFELGSTWQLIATIPEFFWELSLGIWLIVKGFNASPISSASPGTTRYEFQGAD